MRIVVSPDFIKQRFGGIAASLGGDLARAVHAAAAVQGLGYFPALDYFSDRPGVDPKVLATAVNLARAVRDHVQREIPKQLVPVFSQVAVTRVTSPAFTLPRVTTHQPDALDALARHYFPNSVRLDLIASSVERGPTTANMEKVATRRVLWNLRDYFEHVEVTDARVLDT